MNSQTILLKIKDYLSRANTESVGMSDEVIEQAAEEFKAALKKTFREGRKRQFKLSMSNAGRPSCQLVMERDNARAEPKSYAFRMKMLIGDITELTTRAIIRSCGIPVDAHGEKVTLKLKGIDVNGTTDITIGGAVYDIKSASGYSFKSKFSSFKYLAEHDDFGYIGQLYGYAEAKKAAAGGFIAVNKETGEFTVLEAEDTPELRKKHLDAFEANIYSVLDLDRPFTRCFSDEAETFYKKPTGNKKLGFTCSYCDYKFSCWPGLVQKTAVKSEAKNPKMEYYTKFVNDGKEETPKPS